MDDGKGNTGAVKRRWTKHEDEKLREGVQHSGGDGRKQQLPDWKKIAAYVQGRSVEECEQRWQRVLRNGLVKGAFTENEDEILLECMASGRKMTWIEIAKLVPGRIGKQCRERWTNHVDPGLKKGGWSAGEDRVLAEAQSRWGNAWTKIAKLLPGRAENDIKNRWNSAYRRNNAAGFGSSAAGFAKQSKKQQQHLLHLVSATSSPDNSPAAYSFSDNPHHHEQRAAKKRADFHPTEGMGMIMPQKRSSSDSDGEQPSFKKLMLPPALTMIPAYHDGSRAIYQNSPSKGHPLRNKELRRMERSLREASEASSPTAHMLMSSPLMTPTALSSVWPDAQNTFLREPTPTAALLMASPTALSSVWSDAQNTFMREPATKSSTAAAAAAAAA